MDIKQQVKNIFYQSFDKWAKHINRKPEDMSIIIINRESEKPIYRIHANNVPLKIKGKTDLTLKQIVGYETYMMCLVADIESTIRKMLSGLSDEYEIPQNDTITLFSANILDKDCFVLLDQGKEKKNIEFEYLLN